jgi:hypothetical protein
MVHLVVCKQYMYLNYSARDVESACMRTSGDSGLTVRAKSACSSSSSDSNRCLYMLISKHKHFSTDNFKITRCRCTLLHAQGFVCAYQQ